jgi:hypothetical protein
MRWWNLLNVALFDSKLIPPRKIIVKAFRNNYGWCYPLATKGHVYLGINSEFFDRKTFIAVLAHEMIHQWQWTDESAHGQTSHGKTFYQWEHTLQSTLGLSLAESY